MGFKAHNKMIDKETFHRVSSIQRKLKPSFEKTKLINILINLKTYHGRIYRYPEIVEQLKYVLTGAKTKDGDVKLFFWNKYPNYIHEPSNCISRYGTRYPTGEDDGLPF